MPIFAIVGRNSSTQQTETYSGYVYLKGEREKNHSKFFYRTVIMFYVLFIKNREQANKIICNYLKTGNILSSCHL